MDSWRVKYLHFLSVVVAAAVVWELVATHALAGGRFLPPASFAVFSGISCVGPFFLFAVTAQFVVRPFYWSLWCLVLGASVFAAFICLALLAEYEEGIAVLKAEARGHKYMNCAGSVRVFLPFVAPPLSLVPLVATASVFAVGQAVRFGHE